MLERKEFVRRERRSSVAGETEYAFRHLLVRDVAYGQIPRPSRAEKHQQLCGVDCLARPSRGPRRDGRLPLPERTRAPPRRRTADGGDRGRRAHRVARGWRPRVRVECVRARRSVPRASPRALARATTRPTRSCCSVGRTPSISRPTSVSSRRSSSLATRSSRPEIVTARQKRRCCSRERGGIAGRGIERVARTNRRVALLDDGSPTRLAGTRPGARSRASRRSRASLRRRSASDGRRSPPPTGSASRRVRAAVLTTRWRRSQPSSAMTTESETWRRAVESR